MNMEINYGEKNKEFNTGLYEELQYQDPTDILSLNTSASRTMKAFENEVLAEIEKFKLNHLITIDNGVLYTKIDCVNDIEDDLIKYFSSEHPNNIIVVESTNGCFVSTFNGKIKFYPNDLFNKNINEEMVTEKPMAITA